MVVTSIRIHHGYESIVLTWLSLLHTSLLNFLLWNFQILNSFPLYFMICILQKFEINTTRITQSLIYTDRNGPWLGEGLSGSSNTRNSVWSSFSCMVLYCSSPFSWDFWDVLHFYFNILWEFSSALNDRYTFQHRTTSLKKP